MDDDWDELARGVRSLRPNDGVKRPVPRATNVTIRSRQDAPPQPKAGTQTLSGRQIDAGTERRIKRGQIAVEARLDLHGYTLVQAQTALQKFVIRAHAAGQRCVLVVTGKGDLGGGGRGVIRREFPHWLTIEPLKHLILKAITARPEDGGVGAFYLYLRRDREQ